MLAIWRAAAVNRFMRCVRHCRGVRFTTAAQPIASKLTPTMVVFCRSIHAPIVVWRNVPTVMQGSWSGANSSDAADEPVGARLPAIWREAAANRCMRCVRRNRGVRFTTAAQPIAGKRAPTVDRRSHYVGVHQPDTQPNRTCRLNNARSAAGFTGLARYSRPAACTWAISSGRPSALMTTPGTGSPSCRTQPAISSVPISPWSRW